MFANLWENDSRKYSWLWSRSFSAAFPWPRSGMTGFSPKCAGTAVRSRRTHRGHHRSPHQPNVFYMAVVNGGVWKTTDFGNTWQPIFVRSRHRLGRAVAVAPSDANILYVGGGELRAGPRHYNGFYKSADAGKLRSFPPTASATLNKSPRLRRPQRSNRLFVAVEGHAYGLMRSAAFSVPPMAASVSKVFTRTKISARLSRVRPGNPQTIYAVLWAARVAGNSRRRGLRRQRRRLIPSTNGDAIGNSSTKDSLFRRGGLGHRHRNDAEPTQSRHASVETRKMASLSLRRRRRIWRSSAATGASAVAGRSHGRRRFTG